ncbi:MAG: thiamine pyrophosphate-dependent dehydrogenase E1 component subunit alpha [Candidatus Eremiobacteraeota bacterium]|nr:thiamine pyrophosphate-dependent dehydrogenase E1 component subunit alpha [Candidatus Eremiobacteraeota bacterium]MBV8354948.1 thiamine pyrophosphate-dependent dehydrogenase E1 component subunit alpha [Candidatus Eremiobacteraeota bacterium]
MAKALSHKTDANLHPSLERYGLSDEQLVALLRNMLLQRTVDNRGFQLNRQGKIPFALGSEGHEAVQAAAGMAFRRGRDILVPYYRDLGLVLAIGFTPLDMLLSMFARAEDRSGGRQFPNHYTKREIGLMSISSIIAAHVPHAVGAAYAIKYRNETGRVVLCTFGEGATSEGEWHESVNFAAVHNLPIVFLCQNNEFAISVPQEQQMRVKDVAQKASGYGIPGEVFDGIDPLVSYDAIRRAMDRAREGGGPTLLEAKCARFLAHSTDDDDRTYRSREAIQELRKRDPLQLFAATLLAERIIDEAGVEDLKRSVLMETNQATDQAEALPYPAPEDLYTNVYEGDYEPWQ